MFDPGSRYANLDILTRIGADGREVAYVARRFVPPRPEGTVIREHVVTEGERIEKDVRAAYIEHVLGFKGEIKPLKVVILADVNNAMRAEALVEEPGRRLVVALLPEVGQ